MRLSPAGNAQSGKVWTAKSSRGMRRFGATQGWLQSIKIDICGWRPCIAGLVATPRTAASFFVSLFVSEELSSRSLPKYRFPQCLP
jgi:hypothetical protein